MRSIAVLASLIVVTGFVAHVGADPVAGNITGKDQVQAKSVKVHLVLFRGDQRADFAVIGDGATLNLVVRDVHGNEVCRASGAGDRCSATWRPHRTDFYYISVINEGESFSRYEYKAY
jgi:hypothetical protein